MKNKLFISTLVLLFSSASMAELVVVVNSNNGNALDKTTISQIFLGKSKSFPDGSQAIPVGLEEGTEEAKEFNRKALNKSASQIRTYWSRLVFTGKGTPPKGFENNAEVIKLVAANPNVIGYVNASADLSGVKVVATF